MAYDHGAFRVRNLEDAIKFYTEKLGFQFLFYCGSEKFGEKGAFLSYHGARLELIETIGVPYEPTMPQRPYCPHLCFDGDPINGYTRWCGAYKKKPLKKPPQSWCYVEEKKANDEL